MADGEQDWPRFQTKWDRGRSTICDADRDGILGRSSPSAADQRDNRL